MITIDYKSHSPIYEQLISRITQLAIAGVILGDEQLPSVRALSSQLGINPNTVQKAYSILEERGVIYTLQGRGNFISSNISFLRGQRVQILLNGIEKELIELNSLGSNKDLILSMVERIYSEGKNDTIK